MAQLQEAVWGSWDLRGVTDALQAPPSGPWARRRPPPLPPPLPLPRAPPRQTPLCPRIRPCPQTPPSRKSLPRRPWCSPQMRRTVDHKWRRSAMHPFQSRAHGPNPRHTRALARMISNPPSFRSRQSQQIARDATNLRLVGLVLGRRGLSVGDTPWRRSVDEV